MSGTPDRAPAHVFILDDIKTSSPAGPAAKVPSQLWPLHLMGTRVSSKFDPRTRKADRAKARNSRTQAPYLVDMLSLLLGLSILPANIQDRAGTHDLLRWARRRFPLIEKILADARYQGPKMAHAVMARGHWKIVIVKRTDLHRFVVLSKQWIVERTSAWISTHPRLARGDERYATTVATFVRLAMIRLMLKRLTKPTHCC